VDVSLIVPLWSDQKSEMSPPPSHILYQSCIPQVTFRHFKQSHRISDKESIGHLDIRTSGLSNLVCCKTLEYRHSNQSFSTSYVQSSSIQICREHTFTRCFKILDINLHQQSRGLYSRQGGSRAVLFQKRDQII
jgi:hypothetical protein